jgi:hypothetical protein
MEDITRDATEAFIAKWQGVAASELSTSQSFLLDLCRLLGVDAPHPTPEQDYMFERPITFLHGDGSSSAGRIDLYRRGAFVLESKKLKAATHTRGFDEALLRARSQAEQYARALPAEEGRPPFLVVVDVGNRIELYAEFSRSGGTYTPFPDPRSHRIALADLRDEALRDRLRRVWTDPLALDPSRESARVTRAIASQLAELAKSLEAAGHDAQAVAQFLMRCLFTMFAEDVRLLPKDSFRELLQKFAEQPDIAMRMLGELWRDMDRGGFSAAIAGDVLQFNGKLFKQPDTLPLDRDQLALLLRAAKADWKHVEPAIFGTLLERALSAKDRHKLGAHYTPRAYVERLVLPTVIEPLREEWSDAKAAALVQMKEAEEARDRGLDGEKKKSQAERLKQYNIELKKARDIILDFHKRLCSVRVLDPACGSGNFLYVTLEHLKRLEGEVLNSLEELGLGRLGVTEQTELDVESRRAIATEAQTVDPHNLLGIELNPRAAAIAEVVLWIGYLQWHFRTRGDVNPPVPVIRDFRNIDNRDAVLACDRVELVVDERGVPVTRWDGETMKTSPITGEKIPDETARKPVERYVNPRRAAWPDADFVVGNPPFIGNKRMRIALGDGYVEALRDAWSDVPESADLVMYWWHHAAQLTRRGALERFGLITTNSIRQAFNRRVIEAALAPPNAKAATPSSRRRPGPSFEDQPLDPGLRRDDGAGEQALSLVFAIPDHPWVDVADGAAVRIAMTVGGLGDEIGQVLEVVSEKEVGEGEIGCEFRAVRGQVHSDLRAGLALARAGSLAANKDLAFTGMYPLGQGFVVHPNEQMAASGSDKNLDHVLKPFVIARDITQKSRRAKVIDFYPRNVEQARVEYPSLFQWVLDRVKPERDLNSDRAIRENWWLHARTRPELRAACNGISRFVLVPRTAKWFTFHFSEIDAIPDSSVVAIALDDFACLGVLSSCVHIIWAVNCGGRLGVGNDTRYQHQRTFNPFPFPECCALSELPLIAKCDAGMHSSLNSDYFDVVRKVSADIRNLAEQLDTHRKRQQAAHPELTLTGMYNVLEKLRSGEPLSAKERVIHEQGLVSVLRQIHDDLDAAVLDAYGWSDLLPLLRVAHGNDAPAEGQTRDDAKRAFDEAVLERLVALNAERAAEEARGLVRWLRPEFQNPQSAPRQAEIETGEDAPDTEDTAPAVAVAAKPQPWPKDAVAQVRAVADVLAASPAALSLDDIAARFTARGPWKKRLPQLLDMLVAMGRAHEAEGRYRA